MKKILLCLALISLTTFSHASEDHHDEHEEHKDEHKDEQDGFKMSPASLKTFELKFLNVTGFPILIPKNAIYKGLNEANIYRFRDGLFKRIDFKVISTQKDNQLISSTDLKLGDQIVVNGIGYLRIAEIAATGGLESSHSH